MRAPLLGGLSVALLAGVLLALGAGTANWLLGLQGFVVLYDTLNNMLSPSQGICSR